MRTHVKLRRRGVGRGRPPVALIVALIALFVALGGGATAAGKVLFTGKDIKNRSISGVDIKAKSIGPKHLNTRALAKLSSVAPAQLNTGAVGPVGPKGFKGDKGIQGQAGAKGAPGKDGANCYDGHQRNLTTFDKGKKSKKHLLARCRGKQGPPGPAGPQGDPGTDGTDGVDGTNGVDGVDGTTGVDGVDGTNGADGADGVVGYVVVTARNPVSGFNDTGAKSVTASCGPGKVVLGGGVELLDDPAAGQNAVLSGQILVSQDLPTDPATGYVGTAEVSTATTDEWALFVRAICADQP